MRIVLSYFILLFSSFVSLSPALAQDDQKWIVIGRDAASLAQSRLVRSPGDRSAFAVFGANKDRAIANLGSVSTEELTQTIHPTFPRCGGYMAFDTREQAVAEVNNPFYAANRLLKLTFPKVVDQQAHVLPALSLVDKQEIMATINTLTSFGTRFFNSNKGQEAALMLEARWKTLGAGRPDFSVERIAHKWKQNSVIATIKGAIEPDEIVILGAHLDSINMANMNAAPGADDDASGIAVISEILRVLRQRDFKPRRTIQFMAYSAEEVGLKGSKEIAERYASEMKKVVAVLQFDMSGFSGSDKNMYFISDEEYVNKDLTDFLKSLIAEYNGSGPHEITHGDTLCSYGCSDHVSWTRVGYPSAFPFEATFENFNTSIHSPMDVVAQMDTTGTHQARFAKLGLEYAIEIGKSSSGMERPSADSPGERSSR
jgi:bacterial leucyl aminopeptidase